MRRTRGALPRKIACGDVCGDPKGAFCQMLCEFKIRSPKKTIAKNRDIRMKNKEKPPRADRSALPRKIACGDVCGGPGDTLYRMSCELREALTKLVAEWRRLGDDIRMKNKEKPPRADRSVLGRT